MRLRLGHIALLVFQAVWLNVILPGHTRGVVTLPGFEPAEAAKSPACAGSCHGKPASKDADPSEPDGRAAHCAVCFYAMRLTTPPAVDLTPPALELVRAALAVPFESVCTAPPHRPYLGRGPPVV